MRERIRAENALLFIVLHVHMTLGLTKIHFPSYSVSVVGSLRFPLALDVNNNTDGGESQYI